MPPQSHVNEYVERDETRMSLASVHVTHMINDTHIILISHVYASCHTCKGVRGERRDAHVPLAQDIGATAGGDSTAAAAGTTHI